MAEAEEGDILDAYEEQERQLNALKGEHNFRKLAKMGDVSTLETLREQIQQQEVVVESLRNQANEKLTSQELAEAIKHFKKVYTKKVGEEERSDENGNPTTVEIYETEDGSRRAEVSFGDNKEITRMTFTYLDEE